MACVRARGGRYTGGGALAMASYCLGSVTSGCDMRPVHFNYID